MQNPRKTLWSRRSGFLLAAQWTAFFAASVMFAPAQAPADAAGATQLTIATTSAFLTAANEMAAKYQQTRSVQAKVESGSSMGHTGNAIPARLERGEPIDVIVLYDASLDDLIKQGKVLPDSKVDLVRSAFGIAVKAGAPKPDISTAAAFKQTLLNARLVTFNGGVSGVYAQTVLFPRLGISEEMKARSQIVADAAGMVASGQADLVLQQVSELMLIKGIDIVGPLPPGTNQDTIFSAGIPANAPHPKEARELIQYLASPAGYDAIRRSGLEPFNAK